MKLSLLSAICVRKRQGAAAFQSLLLACLAFCVPAHAAGTRWTPTAGSNSTTLVLYSEKREPFALINNLELLQVLVRQFDTRVQTIPLDQATNTPSADYVIVFCPQPPPNVPSGVQQRTQPTLWIGDAAESRPQKAATFESLYDTRGLIDALLSFYGVRPSARPRLLVRIEDYTCRSDHRQFRRLADMFFFRGVPCAVGVVDCDLGANEEFVRSLKYAQDRGARLVLRTKFGFWDTTLDRPTPGDAVRQLEAITDTFRQHGLMLTAWENAGASPPRTLEPQLAKTFPLRIGAVRLSDATTRDEFVAQTIVHDAHGGIILPESFGYVPMNSANGFEELRSAARELFVSPAVVGSFVFHAYLPFSTIAAGMDELRSWDVAFLDLAELRE